MTADRRMNPLFTPDEYAPPAKATDLAVVRCQPALCVGLVAAWHSRLPRVQSGPWKLCFASHYKETVFAVALWNNPSARTLPADWLELRRMAVAPDAPHCTASHMLGQMRRWIRVNMPEVPKLISYQDQDVHTGTIYKAAGWIPEWETKPRVRDRSKPRVGTRRPYRSDSNGASPASAAKTRWAVIP